MKKWLIPVKGFFYYSCLSVKLLWKKSRQLLLLKILAIIVSAVQVFPGMYLLKFSVDMLTKKAELRAYLIMVLVLTVSMAAISLFKTILDNRLRYLNDKMKLQLHLDLADICLHMDYQDLENKEKMKQKDFAQKVINGNGLELFVQSIGEIISGILILSTVVYILSKVSMLILIPIGISLLINILYNYRNAKTGYIDTWDTVEYKRKNAYIQQACRDFSFAKEIRLFHLKESLKKRMDEVDSLLFRLQEGRRKENRFLMVCFQLSDFVMEAAIYLYLGWLVIGAKTLALGDFTLYAAALRQVRDSLNNLLETLTEYAVNTQYLKDFFAFMGNSTGQESQYPKRKTIPWTDGLNADGNKSREGFKSLQFENVSYHYPNSDKFVLRHINITISKGDSVMIVGENGAGKSTFVKLCCGLYKPTEGRILYNGRDISEFDHEEYMSYFSVVFQDYRLFAASIKQNIASMEETIDDTRVSHALSQVGLDGKISAFGKKTNTQLYRIFDREGVELSGGEMQRLAIARAIYKDSDLMILDEPLSALDAYNEYKIYETFREMASERTVLFISHRLSSVKFTNKIVVLEQGEIIGEGSHEELMAHCALYAQLYDMQSKLYLEGKQNLHQEAKNDEK